MTKGQQTWTEREAEREAQRQDQPEKPLTVAERTEVAWRRNQALIQAWPAVRPCGIRLIDRPGHH